MKLQDDSTSAKQLKINQIKNDARIGWHAYMV